MRASFDTSRRASRTSTLWARCLSRRRRAATRPAKRALEAHEHAETASRAAHPTLSPFFVAHETPDACIAARVTTAFSSSRPFCPDFRLRCVGRPPARTPVSCSRLSSTRVRRVSWDQRQRRKPQALCHPPSTGAAQRRPRIASPEPLHTAPARRRLPWRHWHLSRLTRPFRRSRLRISILRPTAEHELTPPSTVSRTSR